MTITYPKLNYDEAISLLQRAIEEKGADYIYPLAATVEARRLGQVGKCKNYLDDGTPSCIVGHVFHYMGIHPEMYGQTDDAWAVAFDLGFELDERTLTLLRRVQYSQDDGAPWGEAVSNAVSTVNYLYGDAA